MFGRLLALFLIAPIVELALLIQLGRYIGYWPTIGIVVLTALIGSYMTRREGLGVWRRFNARLQSGELPGQELLDGVIILVSGALLITPGVLSDLAGFIGLFPVSRAVVRRMLDRRIRGAMKRGTMQMMFGGAFSSMSGFGAARRFDEQPSGTAGFGEGADASKRDRGEGGNADAVWRGHGRDVPGYSQDR